MNIRPLQNRVCVRPDKREEKTPGGIIIPETADERRAALTGTVVSAGPGKLLDSGQRVEPSVKSGDRVLFSKYSGTEIELEGERFRIVSEDDILGAVDV